MLVSERQNGGLLSLPETTDQESLSVKSDDDSSDDEFVSISNKEHDRRCEENETPEESRWATSRRAQQRRGVAWISKDQSCVLVEN